MSDNGGEKRDGNIHCDEGTLSSMLPDLSGDGEETSLVSRDERTKTANEGDPPTASPVRGDREYAGVEEDEKIKCIPNTVARPNGHASRIKPGQHKFKEESRSLIGDNTQPMKTSEEIASPLSSHAGSTSEISNGIIVTDSSIARNNRLINGSSHGTTTSRTDIDTKDSSTYNQDTLSSSETSYSTSSSSYTRSDNTSGIVNGWSGLLDPAFNEQQSLDEAAAATTNESAVNMNDDTTVLHTTHDSVELDAEYNEPSHNDGGNFSQADDTITDFATAETLCEGDLETNATKVVTFAEDKEVFDMGYVLPASVTVHLDTPVSAITPGDVTEVCQQPADPSFAASDPTAYPLSGILKTDGDGKEDFGFKSAPCECPDDVGNSKDTNLQEFDGNAWLTSDSKNEDRVNKLDNPLTTLHLSEITIDAPDAAGLDKNIAFGVKPSSNMHDSHSAPSEPVVGEPPPCNGIQIVDFKQGTDSFNFPQAPENYEQGFSCAKPNGILPQENPFDLNVETPKPGGESTLPHREFIVETVAEETLLAGVAAESTNCFNSSGVDPASDVDKIGKTFSCAGTRIGHGDGGSHSTDSNCHDTIGPLDNPQFLKTLNYTASQAFDQDEHFGIPSAGADARSLAGFQEPDDLDGGWAWVVLTAAFIGATLLGASVYAAGVLMNAILKEIEDDLTKASWVGSVFVCVMSLSGPFVGSVLTRLGARLTVSVAGLILSLGFIGASQSSSIEQLILTHGVVSGLGAGFTINPLFVVVGQYFNKYRGFACGIVAMGAGAGMLSGGAFMTYLLNLFDLSGTYLIWAGLMLHVTPCGLLLRPSPEERMRKLEKEMGTADIRFGPDGFSVNSGPNSLLNSVNHSMMSGIDSISTPGRRMISIPGSNISRRPSKLVMAGNEAADVPLLKAAIHNEMSRSSHSVNRLAPSHTRTSLNKSSSDICGPFSPLIGSGLTASQTPIFEGHEMFNNSTTPMSAHNYRLSSSSNLSPSSNTLNNPAYPTSSSPYVRHHFGGHYRPSSNPHILQSLGGGLYSQYTSTSHISAKLSVRSGIASTAPRGDFDNESMTSAFVSGLRPQDSVEPRHALGSRSMSTMIGSIASFPTSLAIVKDDLRRFEPVGPDDKSLRGYIIGLLDSLRILRNKPFCIFVLTNFFWALGESPVLIHLPSYVVSRGTSPMQASSLYTSMGISSMSGRFLSGLIASDVNIGPVLLYTGSLGVAGVVVCLSPIVTATYTQQVLFSFFVGLYTGSLVPLTSLITIELLGLGELSLGFGLISMAQGFGYLIGPPLSSLIVKAFGFVFAFVCSGFVLLFGSFLALTMTMHLMTAAGNEDYDFEGVGKEEENPLGNLERALQKLANDSGSSEDPDEDDPSEVDLGTPASGRKQMDDKASDIGSKIIQSEKSSISGLSLVSDKYGEKPASANIDGDSVLNGFGEVYNRVSKGLDIPGDNKDCDVLLQGGYKDESVIITEGDTTVNPLLICESYNKGGEEGKEIYSVNGSVNGQNVGLDKHQQPLLLPVTSHLADELCGGQERLDTIIEVVGK